MSAFSFSFSGDDIQEEANISNLPPPSSHAAETGTLRRSSNSAFPVAGRPLLQPQKHDLETMLEALPSKIAYSTLMVKLDDGEEISIPRRELWDVRVQLMAEEDDEGLGNLGKDDVKTGVYEGGFKSWESSVDVVKELYNRRADVLDLPRQILELGCGTALPSLASFQWLCKEPTPEYGVHLGLADYNPTVLQLVTLPNILLSWAKAKSTEPWEIEGELEFDLDLKQDFLVFLRVSNITLSFFSGAWGPDFVEMVNQAAAARLTKLTVIGAETIYSPAALKSFADTLMSLLNRDAGQKVGLVAAKMVYFGVGGSMEDLCEVVRSKGGLVEQLREESDGVRRAVIMGWSKSRKGADLLRKESQEMHEEDV